MNDPTHIKDGIITSTKYAALSILAAAIAAAAVNLPKLKLTTYSYPNTVSGAADSTLSIDTGLSTATTQPILAYTTINQSVAFGWSQVASTWRLQVRSSAVTGVSLSANQLKVVYIDT